MKNQKSSGVIKSSTVLTVRNPQNTAEIVPNTRKSLKIIENQKKTCEFRINEIFDIGRSRHIVSEIEKNHQKSVERPVKSEFIRNNQRGFIVRNHTKTPEIVKIIIYQKSSKKSETIRNYKSSKPSEFLKNFPKSSEIINSSLILPRLYLTLLYFSDVIKKA